MIAKPIPAKGSQIWVWERPHDGSDPRPILCTVDSDPHKWGAHIIEPDGRRTWLSGDRVYDVEQGECVRIGVLWEIYTLNVDEDQLAARRAMVARLREKWPGVGHE